MAISATVQAVDFRDVGTNIVTPLEKRFSAPAKLSNSIQGIIAVGGGNKRMVEAIRLAKLLPNAKLVFTGNNEEQWHRYAIAAGIEPQRIIVEPLSRTTYENANFTSSLLRPTPTARWLLVTSAAHMPRAVGSFRKAGFSITPWPLTQSVRETKDAYPVAQHEWLGLISYWLLGRTDSLFPAPRPDNAPSATQVTRDHVNDARKSS